jgi:uncharacterized membrane protein HdeD (DUF308 family)
MSNVILGAISMASLVAAMFFLRFWRDTHDRFFLLFAVAFALDAVTRLTLGLSDVSAEHEPFFYLARLVTFALILIAIIDKNWSGEQRR